MTAETTTRTTDPRTPVIVGVGQVVQKDVDPDDALDPVGLMIEAVRAAARDSGAPAIAGRSEAVGVVRGLGHHGRPGDAIAEAVGAAGARTATSTYSGSIAQFMLTEYAARIQAGGLDQAIVTGGEAYYSAVKRGGQPADLSRIKIGDSTADELFGDPKPLFSKHEHRMGFSLPIIVYPLFGSAVRAAKGQSQDANRDELASLWAGFSEVAASNPYAWDRELHSAAEIREPSSTNRMISWPYTLAMNANMFVDQAAAVIICSTARADDLGVPLDRRVFPLAAADGADPASFGERLHMHTSPAIRLTGTAALKLADLTIDEVPHFDLYSCFPSVVQVSTAELGIPAGVQLTQTGGHRFFGGPLNSYTLHGIASMVDTLREHEGEPGLVHGNGGHLSKQSICIYSTEPPRSFRKSEVQGEIDALPHRALDVEYEGRMTIESCTVAFDRDGPRKGYTTGLTDRGNRVLATTEDEAEMEAITAKEMIGEPATVEDGGRLRL